MKITIRNLALSALVAFSTSSAVAQLWTGTGGNLNWSNGANWEFGVPPVAGGDLYFEDLFQSGYTNQAKAVNNIVDANTAVGAMNFTARSFGITNHFYTTLIPGGITLTLGGLGASPRAALVVGDVPGSLSFASANNYTNYSAITGPGSLLVNDTASLISVGWRNRATLDLADLNTFSASVKQLWVGVSDENLNTTGPTGWLLLAKTNTITTPADLTAPGVLLGHATNATGNATLLLGQVNNFNTDGFVVGGRRGSSTLLFGSAYSNTPSAGTFTLRGSAGGATPIPVFAIGDSSANPAGYNIAFPGNVSGASGTADFSGAPVDIRVDSLYIGRASSVNQVASGTGNGTLIVEQGTVNATNVFIAYKPPGSTNATIGRGTLLLRSNAVMNVEQDVALVFRTNGTAFIDESIVAVSNNAVLNIGGNLKTVRSTGSWTPAVVRLGGGRINMTGGGVVDVPRITGGGYLTNASSITVTNELTVGTTASYDTLVMGNNLTVGAGVPLIFNLGANTTVGGGVNDYVDVANNITFNNNPITLSLSAPLVVGTYKLIGYGGAQAGSVTWANPTRFPIGLVQGSGQVAIVVTNLTPANLVWQATGTTAAWDKTTLNWNGNTDKFYDLDNVLFDDTGVATNVTIASITNFPSSVTVSNNLKSYTFTQSSSGNIRGYTGLTKDGTNTLTMGAGGIANLFTGPVNVNAGTLKLGSFNTGAFGDQNSAQPINIAAGATLDCNGNSIGSAPGRPVNVAGTGVTGSGAIGHFNATGSANPSITTPQLTLTADAKVGAVATKAINITGPAAPYSGVLNLNGYTLTTAGAGEVRIVQMVSTNAGTIKVENPVFAIRNSIVEGAGLIEVGNNTLSLGGNNAFTTGYVAKAISVTNGIITAPNVNVFNIPLSSPITISSGGALTVNNSQMITASGIISGNGSLTKLGNSNLVLTAANTYAGPTTITGGRLALAGAGSLVSPLITVNVGAGFDVTGLVGGYTVLAGQAIQADGTAFGNFTAGSGGTLRGSGVVAGSVTVASGGTLAAGSPILGGTINIKPHLHRRDQ
jgi:fibronectin-binding autotransporter adhesin